MSKRQLGWTAIFPCGLALLLVACEKTTDQAAPAADDNTAAGTTVAGPGTAVPAANDNVDVGAMVGPAGDQAIAAASPVGPPPGWKGVGLLAQRKPPLPRGSPRWAAVEAEVIVRKGQKYLVATGLAEGVGNQALARTTAENRARNVLTRWVHDEKLEGSQVADAAYNKRAKLGAARVEMPVPDDWVPGQPVAKVVPTEPK